MAFHGAPDVTERIRQHPLIGWMVALSSASGILAGVALLVNQQTMYAAPSYQTVVAAAHPTAWAVVLITSGVATGLGAWRSLHAAMFGSIVVAVALLALSGCLVVQAWNGGLITSALLTGLLSVHASVTSLVCSRQSPIDNLGLRNRKGPNA